jgi:hypothetical protein
MERDLEYDEIHSLFHNTIRETLHSLSPILDQEAMEAETLDVLGRLVASWENKENVRKSVMVLAAMFLKMGGKIKK